MESTPFRFMDLPREIRLMVYERLPRRVKRHRVYIPYQSSELPTITFITRSISGLAILATSRTVNAEARRIIQRCIENFITKQAPKAIVLPPHGPSIFRSFVEAVVFEYNVYLRYPHWVGTSYQLQDKYTFQAGQEPHHQTNPTSARMNGSDVHYHRERYGPGTAMTFRDLLVWNHVFTDYHHFVMQAGRHLIYNKRVGLRASSFKLLMWTKKSEFNLRPFHMGGLDDAGWGFALEGPVQIDCVGHLEVNNSQDELPGPFNPSWFGDNPFRGGSIMVASEPMEQETWVEEWVE